MIRFSMHFQKFSFLLAFICCSIAALNPAFSQVTISGHVQREDAVPIGNIPIFLSGTIDTFVRTDQTGFYSINVPPGSYSLQPISNADPINGVSTFDIVLIDRHISGVELLDSPYKLLAADVDRSGVIDSIDLIQIEDIVHARVTIFPNTNSWRFVPTDYVFPDPTNPWFETVPEVFSVNGLNSSIVQDFVGIKMGDVNYSAQTWLPSTPCEFGCGVLSGRVAEESTFNCLIDDNERPLAGWVVRATDMDTSYYGNTNNRGEYAIALPPGEYTLSLHNPYLNLWQPCTNDVPLTVEEDGNYTQDFALEALVDCPLLEVNVGAPFLRRCFNSVYYVSYCNKGTSVAEDAYVELALDDFLAFVESSVPGVAVGNNTYTFQLGDIAPGTCATFQVFVDVSCESVLGQTMCTEAFIYPNELCGEVDASWDGATLDVNSTCEGDSVRFEIRNLGEDMEQTVEFTVIEDDMIMMLEQNEVLLTADESARFAFPANGSTWRMEVAQTPSHPYTDYVSDAYEGCDLDNDGIFSLGFVTQFPQYANRPWATEFCIDNIGSYDPNDKRAWPAGAKTEHFIEPATPLEYQIRFQNTGTDTAFLVRIQDTLSNWVDPATVTMLSASHSYEYSISDKGVLSFLFPNIMLPDSNVNEAASHGYVKFKIEQATEVPLGTRITNQAAIYFDFNEPIFTNETYHTIGIDFLDIVNYTVTPEAPDHQLTIIPNPVVNTAHIRVQGLQLEAGTALIYDMQGRMVRRAYFRGNELQFSRNDLQAGTYLLKIHDGAQYLGIAKILIQ